MLIVKSSGDLNIMIRDAKVGDELRLTKGVYKGNFIIDKPLHLNCQDGAELDGNHQSNTLTIKAANVTIENCKIINWGDDLTLMNAGIFVEKTAANITIKNNYMKGDTFGMWIDSTPRALIINNKIEGNLTIRSQDRGNGIHLFNVTNALVEYNEVWHTRDGIYIDTSNNNQLINNELHDLRYGIHYMYSYNNLIKKNVTRRTRTGYAFMQSKFLTVEDNRSENDTNYGILMNFITNSTLSGNQIVDTHQQQGAGGESYIKGAEGRALFIYNAHFNTVKNNLLTRSDIAIHLTAGSEDNKIYGNYFVKNKQQVKYVANREVEWSFEGQGNFWSDYQGWDRNFDGIGDEAFEPNDGIDKILWKYPTANVLINSPAVQTLRWVQKKFPVLKSPGIKDSYPLMKNPFQYPLKKSAKKNLGVAYESN
ncbi:MAG: nitrous oxide reductase family maturation protein NosD [Gammaproteobacteria bacterium]|nr:nitrous oxide reductase family maturation protein NosD [Gammaproteobacteria bacterium]